MLSHNDEAKLLHSLVLSTPTPVLFKLVLVNGQHCAEIMISKSEVEN